MDSGCTDLDSVATDSTTSSGGRSTSSASSSASTSLPTSVSTTPSTTPQPEEHPLPRIMSTTTTPRVQLDRSQVPELMRQNSVKRIINQRPANTPTKTLRMKSLLWVKPAITSRQLSSSSILAQLFPTLLVNLAALSSGISLGYSAIALPQLKPSMDHFQGEFHYRPFQLDQEGGSWIASVFGIGAIFGGFASGILGSQLGRRKAILIMTVPDVIGWILIASAQDFSMMLIGRFLCGFASAGYMPAIQIFIAETAQPHHRGWLSALTVPILGLGNLLAYSMGAIMSWQWVAVMAAFVPVILIPGLIFISDSPYWYMQNNQEKKALQVMEKYRSSTANALEEMLAISHSLKDSTELTSFKLSLEKITQRQFRRPFLILNGLFILMTFSGKFAIGFYAVEIFHKASVGLNEYFAAIVIGLIKLLGGILYIPAIRYLSRRTLLCTSSAVMGCSLIVLGLSIYSHEDASTLHHLMDTTGADLWLPLACVTLYTLADPLGLGSVPFLYSAEFYPSEMRSLLSGVTIGLANLEMFLVVKTFPSMMSSTMGGHGTFWLYAGVCFATIVFTLLFVPETKGKSLQEIEGFFAHKESLHVTPYVTPLGTPSTKKKRNDHHHPHLSIQFTL